MAKAKILKFDAAGPGLSKPEILKVCNAENVRFMRLQFTDILGVIKNVEIPRSQFEKALDGEIQFSVEYRSFTATTGAWVTLARHSLHYFKNTGSKPARMLIMVTPAGLENFFRAVGREAIDGETEAGTPTPEDIQKVLTEEAAILQTVMNDTKAPCWRPDPASTGPCQVK